MIYVGFIWYDGNRLESNYVYSLFSKNSVKLGILRDYYFRID